MRQLGRGAYASSSPSRWADLAREPGAEDHVDVGPRDERQERHDRPAGLRASSRRQLLDRGGERVEARTARASRVARSSNSAAKYPARRVGILQARPRTTPSPRPCAACGRAAPRRARARRARRRRRPRGAAHPRRRRASRRTPRARAATGRRARACSCPRRGTSRRRTPSGTSRGIGRRRRRATATGRRGRNGRSSRRARSRRGRRARRSVLEAGARNGSAIGSRSFVANRALARREEDVDGLLLERDHLAEAQRRVLHQHSVLEVAHAIVPFSGRRHAIAHPSRPRARGARGGSSWHEGWRVSPPCRSRRRGGRRRRRRQLCITPLAPARSSTPPAGEVGAPARLLRAIRLHPRLRSRSGRGEVPRGTHCRAITERKEHRTANGNRYREVVQRREGLRLHHAGRTGARTSSATTPRSRPTASAPSPRARRWSST